MADLVEASRITIGDLSAQSGGDLLDCFGNEDCYRL